MMELAPQMKMPACEAGNFGKAITTHLHTTPATSMESSFDFDVLPDAMRVAKRWLFWRFEQNPDPTKKPRKVPYYVNGGKRQGALDSPADMERLASFDDALRVFRTGNYAGLGFALGPDGTGNVWQGIDLDDIPHRPALGYLSEELPGYTERSPSGNGMHAIGYGRPFASLGSNGTGIEAYAGGRFFTVTADGAGIHPPVCLADFVEQKLVPRHRHRSADQDEGESLIQFVPDATCRDLRSALLSMRADDRDLWVRMGHALKTIGEQGRGLWMEWSATSDSFRPLEDAKTWDSFKPAKTSYQAVFSEAQRNGWVNPATKDPRTPSQIFDPQRYADIDVAIGKFAPHSLPWPEAPADLFSSHPVPAFPLDALPAAFATFAREHHLQTGFDAGAYGFALFACAANWIDQRARLAVTSSFRVPAYFWAGLVDDSGGGKSPVISAGSQFVRAIDTELQRASKREISEWNKNSKVARDLKQPFDEPLPDWRQRIVLDTTTEALADLLQLNPMGVVVIADELSEWVGKQDAYSGVPNGKDGPIWIRAYDGTSTTINRKHGGPRFIEHFSAGMFAGVQPQKLADMFKRSAAGGSDGMFQRILCYMMQPATDPDYCANLGFFTLPNVANVFNLIHEWAENGTLAAATTHLSVEARAIANEYDTNIRRIRTRTPAGRYAEHLGKFPGFLNRIAFALHCIECTVSGEYEGEVGIDTFMRAKQILDCLYRHSEAVYSIIDNSAAARDELVRSAGEAILANKLETFSRGDLTRRATYWRKSDGAMTEAAIDTLIELDWLRDVTPAPSAGKRGRKSEGVFEVNPHVHTRYAERAERITEARAERYAAIQSLGAVRHVE